MTLTELTEMWQLRVSLGRWKSIAADLHAALSAPHFRAENHPEAAAALARYREARQR